jgi:hypothetical protein
MVIIVMSGTICERLCILYSLNYSLRIFVMWSYSVCSSAIAGGCDDVVHGFFPVHNSKSWPQSCSSAIPSQIHSIHLLLSNML